MKSQKILLPVFAFVLTVALNSACTKQNAASESAPGNEISEVSTTADPEIIAAQNLIKKNPDAAGGYNKLALIYIRRARETGDFSLNTKAETAVNRALEIETENYDAQRIKASLLLTFHRFQEALEFGKQLQKAHPQDPIIYGVLTDANVELGNYEDAVNAVQQMVDLRPNAESYARVSYVRSLHGDSDGAIEAMKMAARITDPMNKEAQAWCLYRLGNEYFNVGRFEEAEKTYDEALQIFPNYYFALAGKGKARAAAGDYEKAINFYTLAQGKIPLPQTVIELGDLYAKTGKTEEANKQYDLAAFIEEKFGNIDRRTLALLWANNDVKLDEALEIAAAEHEKRKDIYTADIYAWCLYKKGQFESAKNAITEAMRLKTKDARLFYHAGMIEKELGNKKAASEYLKKALELNPSFDVLQADAAKSALRELI